MIHNGQPLSSGAKNWSIFLAILLAVSLVPALVFLAVQKTIFNADYYTQVLNDQGFYEQIPNVVVESVQESLSKSMPEQGAGIFFTLIPAEQLTGLIESAIPADWIESQVAANLQGIMDFINLRSTSLVVTLDLKPIKDNLSGTQGSRLMLDLLSSFPACTVEQLNSIMASLQGGSGGQGSLCNPGMEDSAILDPFMAVLIGQMTTNVPDAITFPPAGQDNLEEKIITSPVFQVYRFIRIGMWLTPWIALVIGLLILLISRKSPRWILVCLSGSGMFAGLSTSAIGASLYLSNGDTLQQLVQSTGLQNFEMILELARVISTQYVIGVGKAILTAGLIALLVGLILWAISRFLKR